MTIVHCGRRSMRLVAGLCLPAAMGLSGQAAYAAAPESDKIVTDRPDFVESSDTVGNGGVQLETSIALERDRADGIKRRTASTPSLLRVGVTDALELRVETDGRMVERNRDLPGGAASTERGYADTSLGVKWHARDAQDGMPSLGMLLHVDLDSGSAAFRANGTRPSLRLSAEWDLPDDFALGVMPGLASAHNDAGRRYTSGIFGVVLGKQWNQRWRSFVEVAAPEIARVRDGGSVVTFDVGGAYLLSQHWQIDSALSRGLTRYSTDWSWTVGLSVKL